MYLILTTDEKKLIKRIARIQLQVLFELINETSRTNVPKYCMDILEEEGWELKIEDLKEEIGRNIIEWKNIYFDPGMLFYLEFDDLMIVRHVIENYCPHEKYIESKRAIWHKMNIFLSHNLNEPENLN